MSDASLPDTLADCSLWYVMYHEVGCTTCGYNLTFQRLTVNGGDEGIRTLETLPGLLP
jgi:hypothetical protein